MEIIETGKTTEEAIEKACLSLGAERDQVEIEILALPKRGFLKSTPAKVKVTLVQTRAGEAERYLTDVLTSMGLSNFSLDITEQENSLAITLKGEGLGVIIGRRGETLDALQYLVGLVVNRLEGEYYRVTIDSAGYREKREKTLEQLAEKKARYVLKTGRSIMLEPMNPYERRIIHACVANIEGVTSKSIGESMNRRVVISALNPKKADKPAEERRSSQARPRKSSSGGRSSGERGGRNRDKGARRDDKNRSSGFRREERSAALSGPAPVSKRPPANLDFDLDAPLYSKITFDQTEDDE